MAVCSPYLNPWSVTMNAFYEHRQDNIRFGYRCFDRLLLNGLIQPFQQEARVVGFFWAYRHLLSGQSRRAAGHRQPISPLGPEPLACSFRRSSTVTISSSEAALPGMRWASEFSLGYA